MTSLTFYGGINEIGGNKILLEDKDTKVFFDFGKGFAEMSKPLNQMSKAIAQIVGGIGKGEVAELLTTEAFRQLFPQDKFDITTASKGTLRLDEAGSSSCGYTTTLLCRGHLTCQMVVHG